jgi:putative transposase
MRSNRELLMQVRSSFEQSDRTYGSPPVWRYLRAWGHRCGAHRIALLMAKAGIQARLKRRHSTLGYLSPADHENTEGSA